MAINDESTAHEGLNYRKKIYALRASVEYLSQKSRHLSQPKNYKTPLHWLFPKSQKLFRREQASLIADSDGVPKQIP